MRGALTRFFSVAAGTPQQGGMVLTLNPTRAPKVGVEVYKGKEVGGMDVDQDEAIGSTVASCDRLATPLPNPARWDMQRPIPTPVMPSNGNKK